MNKDVHNIDDFFRNSIDGHMEEVPTDVWKNIDHSLDKKQVAFYKRKYFAVRAAAIFLILVGGLAIAAILHFRESTKSSAVDSANQSSLSTSNGNNNKQINIPARQKASEKPINEKNNEAEVNTVTVNSQSNQINDQTENNKTINNQTVTVSKPANEYSTQKTEQLSASLSGNKQKKNINQELVANSSMGLVASKQINNREKPLAEKMNNASEKTETAGNFQRIASINVNLLSTIKPDLAAIPSDNINNTPFSLSGKGSIKNPGSKFYSGSWSITPMYAQNINLNTLKDDDHYRDPRNNSHEAKRTEQQSTSFTVGIGVQKEMSSKIALQTGVQYFYAQTSIQPKTIFAREDDRGYVRYQFQCSSGNSYITTKTGTTPAVGDSIKTNFSKSTLSYLQVPLMVSYKISFGRFSLLPSAGLQTNFLLSGKLSSSLAHSVGDEEVSSSINGLRSMYFSGVIQPQLNYSLNDRVSFDLNPNINFSLSPINKETAVKTYQNMISLGLGVRVRL